VRSCGIVNRGRRAGNARNAILCMTRPLVIVAGGQPTRPLCCKKKRLVVPGKNSCRSYYFATPAADSYPKGIRQTRFILNKPNKTKQKTPVQALARDAVHRVQPRGRVEVQALCRVRTHRRRRPSCALSRPPRIARTASCHRSACGRRGCTPSCSPRRQHKHH
jgi:hypothetical protein